MTLAALIQTYLIPFGTSGALLTAGASVVRAIGKRRAILRNAPEKKIDDSMSRMQKASIYQDSVIDNLNEALARETTRADREATRADREAAQAFNAKRERDEAVRRLNVLESQEPPITPTVETT